MPSNASRAREVVRYASGVILAGLLMLIVGIWMLTGGVAFGALEIPQSGIFGGIAIAAGLLFLLGGCITFLRARKQK